MLNTNFTDQLIAEHLGLDNKKRKPQTYIPRDSDIFREFVKSTYFSKDVEDLFSNFFLKEAAKKERIWKTVEEGKEIAQL